MTTKRTTVVGVFRSRDRAEQALADLRAAGFTNDEIGMVARDATGKAVATTGSGATHAEEGAVAGLAVGAGTGALVGAGVLAGVIPVVGPILAIGALGTVLLNAVGGAAIAGLAGALIGYGIPEEDAQFYESEVKAGRFLVTVTATGKKATEAREILTAAGGLDRAGLEPAAGGRAVDATHDADRAAGADRTLKLSEEQLRASKKSVKTGDVGVRKEVHTEHKTVTVPVEREEVVIERRAVHGKAAAGDIHAEEIRVPVSEEKVHVTKETVVKEEVSVGKRKVRGTETVGGDVRTEELVVETAGDAKVRRTSKGK